MCMLDLVMQYYSVKQRVKGRAVRSPQKPFIGFSSGKSAAAAPTGGWPPAVNGQTLRRINARVPVRGTVAVTRGCAPAPEGGRGAGGL